MKYQNERFITLHCDASFEHRRGHKEHPAGVACFLAINETAGDTTKVVESAPLLHCASNTVAEFLSIAWAIQVLVAKLASWTPEYAAAQIDGAIIVIKNDCVSALNAARNLRLTGRLAEMLYKTYGVKPKAIVLKHVEAHKKVDNSASYANDVCDEHAKKGKEQCKDLLKRHGTKVFRWTSVYNAARAMYEKQYVANHANTPWALSGKPLGELACTRHAPAWESLSDHEKLCAMSLGSDGFIKWVCDADKSVFYAAVGSGGIYRSENQNAAEYAKQQQPSAEEEFNDDLTHFDLMYAQADDKTRATMDLAREAFE